MYQKFSTKKFSTSLLLIEILVNKQTLDCPLSSSVCSPVSFSSSLSHILSVLSQGFTATQQFVRFMGL